MGLKQRLQNLLGMQHRDHGARRSKLLQLAMLSSGLSKVTAVGLQGLAIPVVYHTLGPHQYALYLLLTAALATITLMQLGAGPGLTQAIARANALEQHSEESGVMAAAFTFVTITATLGCILCDVVVRIVPAAVLFGSSYSVDQAEIIHTTDIAVLIMFAYMILGVVDSALAGYQEQVATNLGICISNCVTTIVLIVLCRYYHPSIAQIIIVLYGVSRLSRIVNLIMLLIKRPYLLNGLAHMNRRNFGLMMHTGSAFWLISITGMLEQYGGTYLMAHFATPSATAIFGAVYRVVALVSSTVGIITQPLWPALTDAVTRKDSEWISRAARRAARVVLSIAFVLAFLMCTVGNWGIQHILHVDITGYHALTIVLGVYLLSNLWTHYHYVLLMGLDRMWTVSSLVVIENLSMLGLGAVAIPRLGASGMGLAYLLASLMLPAWYLPRVLARRMKQIMQNHPEPLPEPGIALRAK